MNTHASPVWADDSIRSARALLSAAVPPESKRITKLISQMGPVEALAAIADEGPQAFLDTEMVKIRANLRARDTTTLAEHTDNGIHLIVPEDDAWPVQLNDLAAPPVALWVKSAQKDLDHAVKILGHLDESVAVVGSRESTQYGMGITYDLAGQLAEYGCPVVSGGAYGIDAAAHRGALSSTEHLMGDHVPTVAVLASGVNVPYPAGNIELLNQVSEKGLLISENAPSITPSRSRLLGRNRIVAALSRGTVVTEATYRSGTMNTARHAQSLDRALMAVPGPINSRLSAGTHRLIQDGAHLVTDAVEVVQHLRNN